MEHILYSHFEQTVERCRAARLVLAVLDTTMLNYDGLSGTSGLVDLGDGGKGSLGILAHVGVAVNAAGLPLGMFEADADFRRAAGLDRTQDHARACPDTRVVTVRDREGDFWDLISRAEETGAALLVRASRGSIRMTTVSALKEDPPRRPATGKGKKSESLHWMLLTTEGEAGFETARTMLRWRIERFFHALEAGTRVEDRCLDEVDDLLKCLAFDAITAFRVRDLSLLARERPDDPAERHVTREDVTALCVLADHHGFKVPRGPPDMTIASFVVLTGGLAGFHP